MYPPVDPPTYQDR